MTSYSELDSEEKQAELYASYVSRFSTPKQSGKNGESEGQLSLFNDLDVVASPVAEEPVLAAETAEATPVNTKAPKPVSKKEFIEKVKEYTAKAIGVPRIAIHVSSRFIPQPFTVKRTITNFEIEVSKIERFDTINQQMLSSVDAEILEVDDARNTLACMLLDGISELSYDDAEFIVDVVDQYLATIEGTDEEKRRIVRRYATVIINDIKAQVYANAEIRNNYIYSIERSLIVFKPFVKNMRRDGKVSYQKPFTDKKNIKKYLFTGYKKSYYPENAFDSDTERLFSIILEEDPDVIRWIKPPLNQLGIFWQAGQQYNPDFLVETTSGKYMVEVKASNEVQDKDVLAKAREGIKWCHYASIADTDKKPWQYHLITDDIISLGNTFKYTIGMSKVITEE